MREQRRIAVSDIKPDPDQPRTHFDEAELMALGKNMQDMGQQALLIVIEIEEEEVGDEA